MTRGRPQKSGLDYFPLNVDIDSDDKIELIEAKYGIQGFGVVIRLFMKIYKNGYFYEWGEKEQLLLSKRLNVDINLITEVTNSALHWELFDERVFKKHGILTSRGIQRRYLEAVRRRQMVEMDKEHCLLDKNELNSYSNLIIVDNKSENDVIKKQSKVKYSKVNITPLISPLTEELPNVSKMEKPLTAEEGEKLIEEFGHEAVSDVLLSMENYKPLVKKNVSANLTARKWLKMRGNDNHKKTGYAKKDSRLDTFRRRAQAVLADDRD